MKPADPRSSSRRRAPRRQLSRSVFAVAGALLIASAAGLTVLVAQTKSKSLPGLDSSNFKDFDQITKANVKDLQLAWFYPYGAPVFSPVFAHDVVYGLGRNADSVVALDATTGKEIWVHEGLAGITSKGMNYWESDDGKDRRLIFSVNSFLQEIDAQTGKSILTFGIDGSVDMRRGLLRAEGTSTRAMPASPGRIWKNIMVFGGQSGEQYMTPPGDIRAYDVITGKLLWQFHTIPRPGEFGYDSNPRDGWKYMGGANNWGEMAIDEDRGIVYFTTGSATYDFYGADRPGNNLFANCLVALDVRTGKRLWHFQTIHHDLWDLDNVSAPQLVTVMHNGQRVDAVAHAGKTGFLYVFNRVNGEPLWPIEERPVPKSDVPGEFTSPTQPFPTKPPAFARQSFTVDDVNKWLLTPEQYQSIRDRVTKARNRPGTQGGIYLPPAVNEETISMPGNQGGSNWGTTAADPRRGFVFVVGVNQVALLKLEDVKTRETATGGAGNLSGGTLTQGQHAYGQYCSSCHGADQRGAPGVPSLLGVTDRMDADAIRALVNEGRGQMRAVLEISSADLTSTIAYLSYTNPAGRGAAGGGRATSTAPLPPGPVVARGGAPQPPLPPNHGTGPFYPGIGGNAGNLPWPTDVESKSLPPTRYATGYNVMATATKPPYTTITAYDLNSGDIKWQVPNGDDPATIAAGGPPNTGGVGARNGMVVTRTGLLFEMGKDGKARAYDVDTGAVLWTGTVAGQSIGIPAMYESKGRQYVVFMSPAVGAGAVPGAGGEEPAAPGAASPAATPTSASAPHGYIAFALPK